MLSYLSSVLSNMHFIADTIAFLIGGYLLFTVIFNAIYTQIENKEPIKLDNWLIIWFIATLILAIITPADLERQYRERDFKRIEQLQQEKLELLQTAQKQSNEIEKVSEFLVVEGLGDKYEKFSRNYTN